MAVSPLKQIEERSRQALAYDANFFRKFTYFFELRIPNELSLAAEGIHIFPLIIPPESYSMEEPFTMESTPTLGGGLYVEENGIVSRTITLSGTTGFKPRYMGKDTTSVTALASLSPDKRSFSRNIFPFITANLSGQKQFQYLQDSIFRMYADLKRDPATAEDTHLIFHNPKDSESWLVAPISFKLERIKTILYQYNIQLLAIDRADALDKDFSEDKKILDPIKDNFRMIKSGLDLASGALNDLTAIASEVEGLIKNISKIIDGATTVLNAASDFVDGVVAAIETPYSVLESISSLIDAAGEAWETLEQAKDDIQNVPANIKQKVRQIQDGLDRIRTHPESFETKTQKRLRDIKDSQELRNSVSTDTLDAAESSTAPTTLRENDELGTGITAGDAQSAKSELGVGREVFNYSGGRVRTLEQGDTLVNLAARYLGDARLWQHIAITNALKPPFISELASADLTSDETLFSESIGIGSTILIPSFSKSLTQLPVLPVLGVRQEEPIESHLLGTDFALERVGGRTGAIQYDLAIDTEKGSTDVKKVSGLNNIGQVMILRLRTERGTDILYKKVGLRRIVGTNIIPADLELSRFHLIETLNQDSRVASIKNLELDTTQEDSLVVNAEIELRGFTETSNVRAEL